MELVASKWNITLPRSRFRDALKTGTAKQQMLVAIFNFGSST